MKYNTHFQNIRTHFPDLDLLKETEFDVFENEEFAVSCINSCIDLCENASKKLNINLNFAVKYPRKFNATAQVENQKGVITFDRGLIEKLETVISNSVDLLFSENIACLTIQESQRDELKRISYECCISYVFNHELAHILQLLEVKSNKRYNISQEHYSDDKPFDMRCHIYEFDSDLFGSMMSTLKLIENIKDTNYQFNSITLFNSLTILLFTTANIIVEFDTVNSFKKIYFKQSKHPHPFIRIVKCNEQILSFISKNLTISNLFCETILQRAGTMVSQVLYTDYQTLDYPKFYKENSAGIEIYIDEIEDANESYRELTRFKSQKLFNTLTE